MSKTSKLSVTVKTHKNLSSEYELIKDISIEVWKIKLVIGSLRKIHHIFLPHFSGITATSWLGLAMVSVVRCAGIWTNNKCCILDWTKTIISMTWLLPMTNITYFLTMRWSSEEHVRTGYICWFFCGVKEMLHVSKEQYGLT